MSMADRCQRCGARVELRGDHTCPPCAETLDRDVRQPFWGDFAGHPDSMLRNISADTASAARDLARDMASAARDLARDFREAFADMVFRG